MNELKDISDLNLEYDKKILSSVNDYLTSEKKKSRTFLNDQNGYARTSWLSDNEVYDVKNCKYTYKQGLKINHSICHGFISGSLNKDCRTIINTISSCLTPSKGKFIDFISGPDGPWRKVTQHLHVLRDEDNGNCPYATILVDPNPVLSQTYVNYLIATRLASCWSADTTWEAFVNQGLSPQAALVLCSYLTVYDPTDASHDKIDNVFRNPSEMLFSADCLDKCAFFMNSDQNEAPFSTGDDRWQNDGKYISCKRIFDGDPKDGKIFSSGGSSSTRCNHIWNNDKTNPFKQSEKNYKKLFKIAKGQVKLTKADCKRIEQTLYDEKEQLVL